MSGNAHDFLAAALAYAARGWHVFPCHHPAESGTRPRCSCPKGLACGECGKHPRTRNGLKDATTEPAIIRGWGKRWPDANLAIRTGAISRLVGLDVDTRNGGDDSLSAIVRAHGPLPDTPRSRTPNGRHYYSLHPGGHVKNSAGKIAPGIDVRGDNGYLIAPPSLGANGRRYEWELAPAEVDLAPLPDFLAIGSVTEGTESTECTERTERIEAISVHSVHSVTTIEDAIKRTLPTTEGQRHRAIFNFARALKSVPGLADALPADLRGAVVEWHKLALPIIGTKAFEDTYADFLAGWPRVLYPLGAGPLADALARADKAADPPCAAEYECPTTRRLIRLAAELQRLAGESPFFVSCRTLADLLATDQMTVWRRLKVLIADGVLIVAEPATPIRAARYRYTGGKR